MNIPVIRLFATVLLVLVASNALAAEWAIEPSIETRANVTDNLNLIPGVHDNVFNWTVSPKALFVRRTEATEIAGVASLGLNRYPGNSDLNTDDANLALTSQLRGERSVYGLAVAYLRDSTLESELATTGIVQLRRQRNLYSLAPSWSYSLTERSSVFAQYRYEQAVYDTGAGLTDYTNQQLSGGYQYMISGRTAATLSGNFSGYKSTDGSIITNSYGFNVGLTHSHTENLTLSLEVGGRHSDSTITSAALLCEFGSVAVCDFFGIPLQSVSATTRASDDGWVFNASADYKWERSSTKLSASRDINPSGSGLVVQTDRLAIGFEHQFGEKLSASAGGTYLVSRYLGNLGGDTDYYRLDSGLTWRFDERWTAGAGYLFAYQKVKGTPDSASANTIFLSIGYNWPKMSISR